MAWLRDEEKRFAVPEGHWLLQDACTARLLLRCGAVATVCELRVDEGCYG